MGARDTHVGSLSARIDFLRSEVERQKQIVECQVDELRWAWRADEVKARIAAGEAQS